MTLTDEQLDALADRLARAPFNEALEMGLSEPHGFTEHWRAMSREAARWADERQGEVVWEVYAHGEWVVTNAQAAAVYESDGLSVRAIRVIATTTKEVG